MAETIQNIPKKHRIRQSGNVVFGEVRYQPGATLGPRIQTDFQLVVVHEGEVVVTVDGTRHPLPSRHTALLKPGHREHFAFSRTGETHHTWCAVPPRRVDEALAIELRAAPFSLPLTPRMLALMEMGLSTRMSDSPVIGGLIDRLGEAFLYEYLAEATVGGEEAALLPPPVRRAKERIELDFAGPVNVTLLAREACCTPNHLTRLFRRHLGTTPARYLWRTRVQRGVEMLRQTGLSISEIAYRTGFQTPFHFSRLVKEQHGIAPKELRARTWNPVREGRPAPERSANPSPRTNSPGATRGRASRARGRRKAAAGH